MEILKYAAVIVYVVQITFVYLIRHEERIWADRFE